MHTQHPFNCDICDSLISQNHGSFELPGHEWSDVFTSPWLPATLNVQRHDDVNDDEPDEDEGMAMVCMTRVRVFS